MKRFIAAIMLVAAIIFLYKMVSVAPKYEPPVKVSTTLGYNRPNSVQDMEEEQIKWVQAALNQCILTEGLEAEPLEVDGQFGPASQRTTAAFQRAAGLADDGSLDAATITTMINVLDDGRASFKEADKVRWTLETGEDGLKLMKNDRPDGAELTINCNTEQTANSRSTTITVTDAEGNTRQLSLTKTTQDP